jgi:hypothetical protein
VRVGSGDACATPAHTRLRAARRDTTNTPLRGRLRQRDGMTVILSIDAAEVPFDQLPARESRSTEQSTSPTRRASMLHPRMIAPRRPAKHIARAEVCLRDVASTATGIRTPVSAMRGRRPSPLDDSGARSAGPRLAKRSQQARPATPMTSRPASTFPGRSTGPCPVRYLRTLTGTRMWRNW